MSDPPGAEDPEDGALARRFAAARDEAAFRALYRRHAGAVFGLLLRLTGGQEGDAADLLQEAWLRAAGAMGAFRGHSRFRTWVTGIALNCYREWRRHQRPEEPLTDAPDAGGRGDPRGAEIEEVLRALPPRFREVLVLHDVEGYTHEEIAGALGIEAGTSKSRLSRGRRLFRAGWRRGPDGGEP